MIYNVQAIWDRKEYTDILRKQLPEAKFYFDFCTQPLRAFGASLFLQGNKPHIHLEDDISIRDNFISETQKAANEYPNHLIHFSDTGIDEPVYQRDTIFPSSSCMYVPAWFPSSYIEWSLDNLWHPKPNKRWGDISGAITAFLRNQEHGWLRWHEPTIIHLDIPSSLTEERQEKGKELTATAPDARRLERKFKSMRRKSFTHG